MLASMPGLQANRSSEQWFEAVLGSDVKRFRKVF